MVAYQAGQVYVAVKPSFRGFQKKTELAATEAGEIWSRRFEQMARSDPQRPDARGVEIAAEKAGSKYAQAFEHTLRKELEQLDKTLQDIDLKADGKQAKTEIRKIQREIEALHGKKIDIDISAEGAKLKLDDITAKLAAYSKKHADAKLDVNVAAAMAKLAAIKTELDDIEREHVEAQVKIRKIANLGDFEHQIQGAMERAAARMPKFDPDVEGMDDKLREFQSRLDSISHKTIGVDVDAGQALVELAELKLMAEDLERTHPDVTVRVNAGKAKADLAMLNAEIDKTNAKSVSPKVDTSQLNGMGYAASAAATRVSFLTLAITTVGSALSAVGVASVGAFAGITGGAIAATTAVGALAAALIPVAGNVMKLREARNQALAASLKPPRVPRVHAGDDGHARRIEQAAARVEKAKRGLDKAYRAQRRSAERSLRAIADAEENLARVTEDNARRVSEAHQAVADAQERAAAAREAAAERTKAAEERLGEAYERVKDAQDRLTEARKRAREEIKQAAEDAEAALLRQRHAVVALKQAQKNLSNLVKRGGSALEFEAARLNVDQAKYNLKQAGKDRRLKEKNAAVLQREGVEGNKGVIAARRAAEAAERQVERAVRAVEKARRDEARVAAEGAKWVIKAQENLKRAIEDAAEREKKARRDVQDARENSSRAAEDAAERVKDAQEHVKDAIDNLAEAQKKSGQAAASAAAQSVDAANAVQQAYAGMSPIMRTAVDLVDQFITKLGGVSEAALQGMLPGLTSAFNQVDPVIERAKQSVKVYGAALGGVFSGFVNQANSPFWRQFADFADQMIPRAVKNWSVATGNFLQGMASLGEAFDPLVQAFEESLVRGTQRFSEWAAGLKDNPQFQEFIAWSVENGPKIGEVFLDFGKALWHIMDALKDPGMNKLVSFQEFLKKVQDTPAEKIQEIAQLAVNLAKVGVALGGIVTAAKVFGTLAEGITQLGSVIAGVDIVSMFGNMKTAVGTANDGLVGGLHLLKDALGEGKDGVVSGFSKLRDMLGGAKDGIIDKFTALKNAVIESGGSMLNLGANLASLHQQMAETAVSSGALSGALKTAHAAADGGDSGGGVADVAATAVAAAPVGKGGVGAAVKGGFRGLLGVFTRLSSKLPSFLGLFGQVGSKIASVAGPVGIAVGVVTSLIAAFQRLWKVNEDFRKTMLGAWGKIQETLQHAYDAVIKPIFEGFQTLFGGAGEAFDSGFSDVVSGLWDTVLKPIFTAIGEVADFTFNKVLIPAFGLVAKAFKLLCTGLRAVFDTVFKPIFKLFVEVVKEAFKTVKGTLEAGIGYFKDFFGGLGQVFKGIGGIFDAFMKFLKGDFEGANKTAIKALRGIWNGLADVVAAPINFIIDVAYNNGLRKAFNKLSDIVHAPVKLPYADRVSLPKFASGGVLPGYTPGRDVHKFWSPTGGTLYLSGGEGIIRPDVLRALGGKKWLDWVNKHLRGGRLKADSGDWRAANGGVYPGSVQRFAGGGVWGSISGFGKGVFDWVGSALKKAADFVDSVLEDPLGAIKNLVFAPVRALLGGMDDSQLNQILRHAPTLFFDAIAGFFKNAVAVLGGGVGGRLVRYLRSEIVAKKVPYVWGGASIPPGLDCSGMVYYGYNHMPNPKSIPRLTAAGYDAVAKPVKWNEKRKGDILVNAKKSHIAVYAGGNRLIEEPRPGGHAQEVPLRGGFHAGRLKYDQGGFLTPGETRVVNLTGKPEPVLTAKQWADIHTMARKSMGGAQVNNNFSFTSYYPVAEPDSVKIARALQSVPALTGGVGVA